MVYIVLGVVAFLCFAFCIYMLVKVEHEPVKKHKPAWQDDDAEDESEEEVYDLPAKKKDTPAPKKYKKSKLLRSLEILCGILFAIALILLIWDISAFVIRLRYIDRIKPGGWWMNKIICQSPGFFWPCVDCGRQ